MLFRLCAVVVLLPLCILCAPLRRREPSDTPTAPLSDGHCRLRLNEVNIYPSGSQQFIELIKICDKDPLKVFEVSMEDSKKSSVYKLIFMSHDGYLIGVCDLRGKATSRHGFHLFYTVGAEHYKQGENRDMKLEDCNFATDFDYASPKNRFPAGQYAPVGLGLIYNKSPTTIAPISLDKTQNGFKRVRIDNALKKKIVENMQDFIVYTSSSPYTHCKYFMQFYTKYSPASEGLYLVRDWAQMEDNTDYSRSRCSTLDGIAPENWLPFHPKDYSYAPASPNSPNICEKAVKFVLEDLQQQKTPIQEDFGGESSCYISTEDEAIKRLHTITDPIDYGRKLKLKVQAKTAQVSSAIRAVRPTSMPVVEFFGTEPPDNAGSVPPCDDVQQFPTTPIQQEVFELQLDKASPHIWSTCDGFEPKGLIRYLQSQKTPDIYPDDILKPSVCSWFEYLLPTKKFKCKFCNLLLKQGIITETKGSKLITLIMTTGQGYSDHVWAKTSNSKLIHDHTKNVIHVIAEVYFTLFDAGKRGTELQKAFERTGGPMHVHLKATDNAFYHVFQCIRLDIPFEKYEISAETFDFFEVDLGVLYLNPSGYKTILMSISQTMHEEFVSQLLKDQPVLSIMIDTSTDISSIPTLAVVFHVFGENGQVEVRLYRIVQITKGETAQALFDLFKSSLEKDGLENYVKSKCIGFSSDGGSNVIKFRKLLNTYTEHKLAAIHCMNHRLELSIKNAWKEIPELKQVDELVNILYSMFHRSAKKKIILAEAQRKPVTTSLSLNES